MTKTEQDLADVLRSVMAYLTGRKIEKRVYMELLGEIRDAIARAEGYKMPGGHS